MRTFFSKKAIGLGIGLALGNIVIDLVNKSDIDWRRTLLAAGIGTLLYALYEKLRTNKKRSNQNNE